MRRVGIYKQSGECCSGSDRMLSPPKKISHNTIGSRTYPIHIKHLSFFSFSQTTHICFPHIPNFPPSILYLLFIIIFMLILSKITTNTMNRVGMYKQNRGNDSRGMI